MQRFIVRAAFAASFLLSVPYAKALTISEIDLSSFSFDVVAYSPGSDSFGLGGNASASGTSGGIGWTITPTSIYTLRTVTNGTFRFSALPNPTDNLHVGLDYTITFEKPIRSLLVALSNDNPGDSINFGLNPSDYRGVSFSGTQALLSNAAGGLALFENINSLSITNTNNNGVNDGYDLAFYAVSAVPNASSTLLLSSGILLLAPILARRRKA